MTDTIQLDLTEDDRDALVEAGFLRWEESCNCLDPTCSSQGPCEYVSVVCSVGCSGYWTFTDKAVDCLLMDLEVSS